MEMMKSIAAVFATMIAWVGAWSVQDMVTFLAATAFTIASTIYVVIGIQNRLLEKKIKQKTLEDLHDV